MDLIHEIDKLDEQNDREASGDQQDIGYSRALEDVRELAVVYTEHRQKADARVRELQGEVARLSALTSECGCNQIDVEGPSEECPVHGAVRGMHKAHEENARLRDDLEAATHFLVGSIRIGHRRRHDDWETWGDPALGGYEVLPKPEHHPDRDAALARARQLKEEK